MWLIAAALAAYPVQAQVADGALPPATAAQSPPGTSPEGQTVVDPPAAATEDRLTAVERQLQALLASRVQPTPAAASPPSFQIGGMVQVDYVFVGQTEANRATVGDAEDVIGMRRARLTGRGVARDVVEYAVGFDFALAGRPSFLDNYVAVTDLPLLGNLRAGHFFEPFSLERFTIVRFTTFMERSLADTLAPARNVGIMAYDTIGDDQLGTWAAGWFRSNSDVFGDSVGSTGGWAVTSRLTWLPYYDLDAGGRSFVHLGLAGTFRSEEQRRVQFQSFPEARAGARALAIPPFVDTGIIDATSDQRAGFETALVYGPLYLQAEYILTAVDQIGGPLLFFQGAYAFASYFLTGENRTYNKRSGTIDRVYPYEDFFRVRTDEGAATGSGAWEVAVRWSFIDLTSRNVQGGTLHDITLALNWHLNPFARVKWEYIYAHLDRPPAGNSFAQFAGMRFDIDF